MGLLWGPYIKWPYNTWVTGVNKKNSTCRADNWWITGFRCTNWKPSQLCSERNLINPLHITVPLVGVVKEKMNTFWQLALYADSHLQMGFSAQIKLQLSQILTGGYIHLHFVAPFIHSLTHPKLGTVSLLLRRLFIAFNLSPAWRFQWCESWEFSVDGTKTSKNPTVASWNMRKYSLGLKTGIPFFWFNGAWTIAQAFNKQQHTCDSISIGWSVSLPDFWLTINHRIFPTTPLSQVEIAEPQLQGGKSGEFSRVFFGFRLSGKWCSSGVQVSSAVSYLLQGGPWADRYK